MHRNTTAARRSFNSNVFGPTRYWILCGRLAASCPCRVEMPPNRRGAARCENESEAERSGACMVPDLTFKTLNVTVAVLLFAPSLLSHDARHNEPTLFSYFGVRKTDAYPETSTSSDCYVHIRRMKNTQASRTRLRVLHLCLEVTFSLSTYFNISETRAFIQFAAMTKLTTSKYIREIKN